MNPTVALRDWIAAHTTHADPAALTVTTPIIEGRYLTSLQITDLILFIEEIRGAEIDIEELAPGTFRDIESICRSFFPAFSPAAAAQGER